MDLQELTSYESGVVIFKVSEEGLIANWSSFEGIPRVFVTGLIGLNDDDDLQEVEEVDTWALRLARDEEGSEDITIDKMYENDEVIIFTFEGWN